MASRNLDRFGDGGSGSLFSAPIVPGRTLPAHERQTASVVVQPISHNAVLSFRDSGRTSSDDHGAVSVDPLTDCKTRSRNSLRDQPGDRTDAGALRSVPHCRPLEEQRTSISLPMARRSGIVLVGVRATGHRSPHTAQPTECEKQSAITLLDLRSNCRRVYDEPIERIDHGIAGELWHLLRPE